MKFLNLLIVSLAIFSTSAALASNDLTKITKEIADYLDNPTGITVKTVDKVIFIEGDVGSLDALNRIDRFASELSTKANVAIANMTFLSKTAKQTVAEELTALINKNEGAKGVTVSAVGNAFQIEGTVASEFQADRAVALCKSYLNMDSLLLSRAADRGTATNDPSLNPSRRFVLLDMVRITAPAKQVALRKK